MCVWASRRRHVAPTGSMHSVRARRSESIDATAALIRFPSFLGFFFIFFIFFLCFIL